MHPPLPNNTRYKLELERNALLQENYEFDEKYGMASFAFLTSLEAFALLAYLYIGTVLIYYKKTRTKTNFIVSVWAIINAVVLLGKLSRAFGVVIGDEFFLISEEVVPLSEMVAALGRLYGSLLSFAWVFEKYFGTLKTKYNIFIYFLMSFPTFAFFFYVYYYFAINKFILEVYGPGCDVLSASIYLLVLFTFVLCKIFTNGRSDTLLSSLLISLINLVTNMPICLITIYLRFNLDINWKYKFHINFVDFLMEALICTAAFAALLVLILYNDTVRQNFVLKKKKVDDIYSNTEQIDQSVQSPVTISVL